MSVATAPRGRVCSAGGTIRRAIRRVWPPHAIWQTSFDGRPDEVGCKESERVVMLTLRALQPSRAAIASTLESGVVISSSSQRRPVQSRRREAARFSERMGRTW